ncbi:hypothetical protein [Radiobacillus sp. PE A8.2]|uniref:hypothetical protein n=1 Tax=Radiobacillus sp. PE A8.2 TaxID=3380349 RepID=UPI00388F06F9
MKKIGLWLLIGGPALCIVGVLAVWLIWKYEPVPNKSEVEEMVGAGNLVEFGEVEGSYLFTPRNYGYYNDENIYIVEQYLDKGEEYGNQYVLIGEGIELMASDEQAVNQVKSKYSEQILQSHHENLQVLSKHQMSVYKDNEKVREAWLFKVTFDYDGAHFLSFVLPAQVEEDKFNFFEKGFEKLLQF